MKINLLYISRTWRFTSQCDEFINFTKNLSTNIFLNKNKLFKINIIIILFILPAKHMLFAQLFHSFGTNIWVNSVFSSSSSAFSRSVSVEKNMFFYCDQNSFDFPFKNECVLQINQTYYSSIF